MIDIAYNLKQKKLGKNDKNKLSVFSRNMIKKNIIAISTLLSIYLFVKRFVRRLYWVPSTMHPSLFVFFGKKLLLKKIYFYGALFDTFQYIFILIGQIVYSKTWK